MNEERFRVQRFTFQGVYGHAGLRLKSTKEWVTLNVEALNLEPVTAYNSRKIIKKHLFFA